MRTLIRRTSTMAAAAAIAIALGAGDASAATKTGWVGPTPAGAGGQLYLTTSTINNAPLEASSRIYTAFGNQAASGYMGVQARLFKSGVLCQITDYIYNSAPANAITTNTYGDCGTGSYNSHGFVKYWTGSAYGDFLTFPTDPLNYTAPIARSATPPVTAVTTSTNERGQTIGTAENARTEEEQPDLIAAIATNGQQGYIRKADTVSSDPTSPEAAATQPDASKTIGVYAANGVTRIGDFVIH